MSTAWGWEQLLLSLVAPTYAVLWGINPEQPHDMTGLDNHTQTHSQLSWGWSYRTPCFETKLPVLLAELPPPPLPPNHSRWHHPISSHKHGDESKTERATQRCPILMDTHSTKTSAPFPPPCTPTAQCLNPHHSHLAQLVPHGQLDP